MAYPSRYAPGRRALLLLLFRYRRDSLDPWLLRAPPDLPLRHELVALVDGADADEQQARAVGRRRRVDRRAAPRTERLLALVAAVAGLNVDRRLALDAEARAFDRHHGAE